MSEIISDTELEQVSGGSGSGKYIVYTICKGETLGIIARRYGTTVAILCEINYIPNPDMIHSRQKILIPVRK